MLRFNTYCQQVVDSWQLFKLCLPKIWAFILIDTALAILFHLLMPPLNTLEPVAMMAAMEDSLIYITFYAVITVIIHTALFYRIGTIANQADLGYLDSVLTALQKLWPIMLATLLYLSLIGLGVMFMIIPAIWLAVLLRFFTPLILFENATVIEALKRSYQLVWGHWLRTAIVLAIPLLFSISLGLIMSQLIEKIFMNSLAEHQILLVMQIAYLIVDKMLIPWFYAAILLQYYDLKTRQPAPLPTREFIA